MMRKAARQGRLAALQWLQGICLPFNQAHAGLMAAAASHGQLHIMRFLQAGPVPAPWTIYDSHCAQFQPACLKWLLEQDPPCPSDGVAIKALAKCGDLATLQLVFAQGTSSPYAWDKDVTYEAASNGRWPVLRWL